MDMSSKLVLVEVKDEAIYHKWRLAHATWEPESRALTVSAEPGGEELITLPVDEIARFEAVLRKGISTLPSIALGALLADSNTGLGCWLSLILAPIAAIDRAVASRTRVPVVRLTQAAADNPRTLWMRSRRRGRRGREETRDLANWLADALREAGYSGSMPNLSNDDLWLTVRRK